jgi:hypothetical protein
MSETHPQLRGEIRGCSQDMSKKKREEKTFASRNERALIFSTTPDNH